MNLPPIRTLNLLITLVSALLYLTGSLAILRVIAPALISSPADDQVALGFVLIAAWLVVTIVLAHYLYTKRRNTAAITKEEDQ